MDGNLISLPSPIAEYKMEVLERHLDTFGHVNNAVYLEIFEEARWDLITRNGYGLKTVQRERKGPVILEVNLKFKAELHLRSKIKILTQVIAYEKKISHLKQWIEDDKGQICAEADFKFGFFDLEARKLILPTPEWLKGIGLS